MYGISVSVLELEVDCWAGIKPDINITLTGISEMLFSLNMRLVIFLASVTDRGRKNFIRFS